MLSLKAPPTSLRFSRGASTKYGLVSPWLLVVCLSLAGVPRPRRVLAVAVLRPCSEAGRIRLGCIIPTLHMICHFGELGPKGCNHRNFLGKTHVTPRICLIASLGTAT